MFGMKDYVPNFFCDKNAFLLEHGKRLRQLRGSKFESLVTVHDEGGELWADCPVILIAGGIQVEFCSFKEDISLTWNEIDTTEKLDWYGISDLFLEWKTNMFDDESPIIGKSIKEIEIIEGNPGQLLGIGFSFGENYFSLFNALDETAFSFVRDDSLLYTKINEVENRTVNAKNETKLRCSRILCFSLIENESNQ